MRRKTRQSTGWEMQVHSELMTIELLPWWTFLSNSNCCMLNCTYANNCAKSSCKITK
jgi:hypothetical protein